MVEKVGEIRWFLAALSARPEMQTKGEERNRKPSGLHSVRATTDWQEVVLFDAVPPAHVQPAPLPVDERSQFSNVNLTTTRTDLSV